MSCLGVRRDDGRLPSNCLYHRVSRVSVVQSSYSLSFAIWLFCWIGFVSVFATLDDRGGHYTWEVEMGSSFVTHADDQWKLGCRGGNGEAAGLGEETICGQSRCP